MKKIIVYYLFWSIGFVFCISVPGFGEENPQCPAPERVYFEVRTTLKFTNQNQGFIPIESEESIGFVPVISQPTSTLISRAIGTWDFGDKSTAEPYSILRPTITHSYAQGGKSYPVHLEIVNLCTGPTGTSAKRESFNTIYVVDKSSRPSLEGLGSCSDDSKIPANALSSLSTDDLLFVVTSLRNSRAERVEVNAIAGKAIETLASVDRIHSNNWETRERILTNIIHDIDKADNKIAKAGPNSLEGIKAAFVKIKTEPPLISGQTGTLADAIKKTRKENRDDIKALTELEIKSNDTIIRTCDQKIADVENKLRKRGHLLNKKNFELENAKQKTDISKEEWFKSDDKIKENQAKIKRINKVTKLTQDDLFQTFNDYDQYFFKFSAGYEFTTVNKLFQKGNPLIGFSVYQRFHESPLSDAQYGLSWPMWGDYGWQSKFCALVSGSGEQETVTMPTGTSTQPVNSGTGKAIGFDQEFFLPMYRTGLFNDGRLREYIGPVILVGARIVEIDNGTSVTSDINSRLYAGIKFAMNPELYTDVLYGKTQRLQSKRLELRAQMPIYRINNDGSRFFLGAIGNIGVKDKVPDEADDFRIYITWNVNFDAIYSYFSGKKIDQTAENK